MLLLLYSADFFFFLKRLIKIKMGLKIQIPFDNYFILNNK